MSDNAATDVEFADRPVIFVCGALRSGTTLLRLMINHHGQMSNPGEMDFLFEWPFGADGKPDLDAYKTRLLSDRIFRNHGLELDDSLALEDLVRSFVKAVRATNKQLTINIHRNFERISEVFPHARYIHLIRDPRDVARSSVAMGWTGNVYHGVDHWVASERSFDRLRAGVDAEQILLLRNEDLILHTDRELHALCDFARVEFDDGMLNYTERSAYSAPDPALVKQWKRKLSPRETGLVEGRIGSMLAQHEYEPSGYPVINPSTLEQIWLKLENQIGRLVFSIERFGLGLTALDVISRRLPFRGLRRLVQRRFNEITIQHLK